MSKRTSDSKVKAPLSALAARRLRLQQEAASAPGLSTPPEASPATTPLPQDAPRARAIENRSGHAIVSSSHQSQGSTPEVTSSTPILSHSSHSTPRYGNVRLGPDAYLNAIADSLDSQLSNFNQNQSNYIYDAGTNNITVKLRRGETLVVQGEYTVAVESGSLAIHGAILNPTDVLQVIAPATHALPIIECAPRSKKRKIEKPASATEYDATFRLETLTTGLGNVGMVCPRFDKIWRPPLFMTETGEQNGTTSFTPIFTSAQHIPTITIPPSWQSPLSSLSSAKNGHRVVFITGGKSVGKSTFGKCLMNQIITNSATPKKSVAYMDVDPGQPSFTSPCMVSLHTVTAPNVAPSYASFNSTTLLRQHHIGYTSPREDPRYYLRCAADLYKHYRAMVDAGDEMTLIVNTCGWIKGLGRELLRELVNACSPTDVVGLGDMEGVFADIIPPNLVCKSYQLEGAGTSGPFQPASVSQVGITNGGGSATQQYSPADLRLLQTIAYFHLKSCNEPGAEIFDFGTHMTGLRPIIASFRGAERAIDAITVIDAEITPDLLSTTINATIVAINLIKSESKGHPVLSYLEGLGTPDQDTTPFIPSELFDGTTSLLPPEDTITVGLAIVRAVDHQRGELHILTPIAEDMFQRWIETGYRIVFTRGRDEMPVWLLWDWRKGRGGISAAHTKGRVANITNDGNPEAASGTPYLDFVVGGEVSGKGAKEWKVRRNIMRRSQHRAGK